MDNRKIASASLSTINYCTRCLHTGCIYIPVVYNNNNNKNNNNNNNNNDNVNNNNDDDDDFNSESTMWLFACALRAI